MNTKNLLRVLLGGIACACSLTALADTNATPRLSVEEFAAKVAIKTNIVLDVRTPKEFADGHIAGAINQDFLAEDFAKAAEKLDRSKTYLVHCAAGGRSQKACRQLQSLGFTNLFELRDGLNGWKKAGKPVEK